MVWVLWLFQKFIANDGSHNHCQMAGHDLVCEVFYNSFIQSVNLSFDLEKIM